MFVRKYNTLIKKQKNYGRKLDSVRANHGSNAYAVITSNMRRSAWWIKNRSSVWQKKSLH